MALLDDVQAAKAAAASTNCSVCGWLGSKPEAFRTELADALASDEETTLIHAVITAKHGFTRSATTLRRHRRECARGPRG
jgi:hypothetical protein